MTKRTADGITTPKSAVRQRTGSNSFSKESYEYDKYGYLTRIVYQRITGNNQKTSGYLTCLYDDYGNRIDGNPITNMIIQDNGSIAQTATIRRKQSVYSTFTNKMRCSEPFPPTCCYYSITSQLKLVTL